MCGTVSGLHCNVWDSMWIALLLVVADGVAGAYHSALSDDLHELTFSQETCMSQHLVECFERKKLSAFLQISGPVNTSSMKHLFVYIYCVCQLPEP